MPPTVTLPILPLRDIVAFPMLTLPLLVGRPKSLQACAAALRGDRRILLVAQRNPAVEEPDIEDLYETGTIAILAEQLTLPQGRMKLLVRGERRGRMFSLGCDGMTAVVEAIDAAQTPSSDLPDFSLADWTADGPIQIGVNVAELQRILEDESLTPAERLHTASERLGS